MNFGLHPNMPDRDYRDLRALNFSLLKEGRQDVARMAWAMEHPRRQSESMALGTAAHAAILEPGTYADRFKVAPDVDRRTSAGKAAWSEFVASANGAVVLDSDTDRQVIAMRRSCLAHPVARKLLATPGQAEVVAHWQDRTGYPGKAKIDRLIPGRILLDLKTARCASPEAFAKAAWEFGYFMQDAWYTRGFAACTGEVLPYVMVVVETEPPYPVGVYSFGDETRRRGEAECDRIIAAWREWRKDPRPAMYGGSDIEEIDLPTWAMNRIAPVAVEDGDIGPF